MQVACKYILEENGFFDEINGIYEIKRREKKRIISGNQEREKMGREQCHLKPAVARIRFPEVLTPCSCVHDFLIKIPRLLIS